MSKVIIFEDLVPEVEKTAFDVFSHADFSLLQPYVDSIREHAQTVDRSIDTPEQRKALASEAYKFARLKTALGKVGADESKRVKEIPRQIDANRKKLNEDIEQVQMWVREPLTKWEAEEKERVDYITSRIDTLKEVKQECHLYSIETLSLTIHDIENQEINVAHDDFVDQINDAKAEALQALKATLEQKQQAEAERQELERLRAQAAENERLAQIEKAKQEAAEQARLQAEREAEQRLEAERLRIREMELQAQRDKEAQEQALRDAEAARLQAVEDARLQAENAENERKLALERAEQERLQAIEDERQRIESERLAEEEATKQREANKKHKAKINNEALADIMAADASITKDQAKTIVQMIALGNVRNVKIFY